MALIILGMVLFALPHFFSSFMPAVRDRVAAQYGLSTFKGAYSAITAVGVILIAVSYWMERGTGHVLYATDGHLKHATMGLATLGMFSVSAMGGKSHIRLWLQNPMSVGLALWSLGHLLSVGSTAAVLGFLTFLAVSLVDIVFSTIRGDKPEFRPEWSADLKAVGIGLVLTALLAGLFHPYVLGVYPWR